MLEYFQMQSRNSKCCGDTCCYIMKMSFSFSQRFHQSFPTSWLPNQDYYNKTTLYFAQVAIFSTLFNLSLQMFKYYIFYAQCAKFFTHCNCTLIVCKFYIGCVVFTQIVCNFANIVEFLHTQKFTKFCCKFATVVIYTFCVCKSFAQKTVVV